MHGLLVSLAIAGVAAREPRQGGIYQGGDRTGCRRAVNASAAQAHTVRSGGLARNYTVTLPADYDAQQAYPVLVGYHGYPGRGLYLEVDSGLDAAAPDKIVVYPDGVGGAWAGASYSATTPAQDLQFTWDLLADVRARYCVDSARVYATGMSNGAGFVAAVLACNATVAGEFAAFAPVAGAYYADARGPRGPACAPARPLTPLLEFHGGADRSVPYGGGQGEGGYEPPIADWCVPSLLPPSPPYLTVATPGSRGGPSATAARRRRSRSTASTARCTTSSGRAAASRGCCSTTRSTR